MKETVKSTNQVLADSELGKVAGGALLGASSYDYSVILSSIRNCRNAINLYATLPDADTASASAILSYLDSAANAATSNTTKIKTSLERALDRVLTLDTTLDCIKKAKQALELGLNELKVR